MNDYEHFDDAHPLHDNDEYYQNETSHRHAQRKKRQRRDSSQQQQKNDASYSYYTRSTMACSDAAATSTGSSSSANNRMNHPRGNFLDLTMIGKKCVLHRNDDLAEQLEQGKHLIDLLEHEDHHMQPSHHRQHQDDHEDPYSSDTDEFYSQQDNGVDNGGIHASSSPPAGKCNSTWTDIIHPPFVNNTSTRTSNSTNDCSRAILMHHHHFVDRHDARTLLDDVSIHEGSVSIYSHKREANDNDLDLDLDHDLTYDEKQVIDIERFGDLKLEDEEIATRTEKYRECKKTGGDGDEGTGTAIPGGSHKLDKKLESPTPTSSTSIHINSKTNDVNAGSAKEDGFQLDENERAMLPLGIAIVSTVDRREIRITRTISYIMPVLGLILVPKLLIRLCNARIGFTAQNTATI